MKNSVLLLNNTYSETDFIKVLKKRYKKIYTLSNTKAYNIDKKIKHITLDYKDHKKIIKLIKKYKFDHVFPGSNDLTLFTLSRCGIKNYFLDSYKKLYTLHNKRKFREFYKQIFFFNYKNYRKKIKFSKSKLPILAKPHVGSGGKNIYLFKNHSDLKNFVEKNKEKYLFEEYFTGTDHGVFTLIKDKKIIFNFFDTEQRYKNPFTVSSTINYCNIPEIYKKKILKEILFIVRKLNLKDGIFHIQIKYNKIKKKFLILEPFRRIPGDKYLKFIRFSTGYPVEENILRLLLNENQIESKIKQKNYILRKILMSPKNGKFKYLQIKKVLSRKIIDKNIFIKKDDIIEDFYNQRLGIIFFRFKNRKEMIQTSRKIDNYIKIKLY
tara:strand:+ start:2487 stop:3626 length:1140 start_codon:yes stop_codon:yes gene_type:complete